MKRSKHSRRNGKAITVKRLKSNVQRSIRLSKKMRRSLRKLSRRHRCQSLQTRGLFSYLTGSNLLTNEQIEKMKREDAHKKLYKNEYETIKNEKQQLQKLKSQMNSQQEIVAKLKSKTESQRKLAEQTSTTLKQLEDKLNQEEKKLDQDWKQFHKEQDEIAKKELQLNLNK